MEMEEPVSEESSISPMSECAMVNLVFTISSSKGVRKDTFFSAGNRGRIDILRMLALGWRGLFASTECRTWEIEYGIVAEFKVEAELTDDELGVLESSTSTSSESEVDCTELSMHSRGLVGRPAGADCVRSGS
jgi:hypothetical protein